MIEVDEAADSDEDVDGMMTKRLQHDAVCPHLSSVLSSLPLPALYQHIVSWAS